MLVVQRVTSLKPTMASSTGVLWCTNQRLSIPKSTSFITEEIILHARIGYAPSQDNQRYENTQLDEEPSHARAWPSQADAQPTRLGSPWIAIKVAFPQSED